MARELSRSAPIDLSVIENFRDLDDGSGEDMLTKLIDVFIDNTPRVLAEAHSALATSNGPLLAYGSPCHD